MTDPFANLPRGHYGVVYADPPWLYEVWSAKGTGRSAEQHYDVMDADAIKALPVQDLAAADCVLLLWVTWSCLKQGLDLISHWGFEYKTCGFDWMKASNTQPDFWQEEVAPQVGLGHWTRSNTEPCLLATKGHPKRLNADVRMGVIAPRRQHSRKPEGMHARIERLVAGPYLELFARQKRAGWDVWGNQTDKFPEYDAAKNAKDGYDLAISELRKRHEAGK